MSFEPRPYAQPRFIAQYALLLDSVFDRRGPPHKPSSLYPAHAGRDGQKPIQAARPGGLLRSSGFPIRDAVPASTPYNSRPWADSSP